MTDALYRRDAASLSRLQNLRFFPLAVCRGEGTCLRDETGRRLLDLSASWGAASLGHGHPALVEAISRAARDQAGCSVLSAASEPATRLAEKLLALTPGGRGRRVWLGHSGSDANETVARAVLAATGRRRLLAFSGAYHGGTAGSMAVSGHSAQAGVEKAPGLTLVPYPDPYRPYRGDGTGAVILDEIEALLRRSVKGEEVAAFFIEPIQADGGLIVPPAGFLSKLAVLCERYGILTVCDEVKVGLARTGKLHCFQHEDFTPDILVFGKGLGGGLPISAVVGPARILNHGAAFSMQTLQGNAVCAAAALAVLETIERDGLAERAAEVGRTFMGELQALQSSLGLIGDVRGRGLALGAELVSDRARRTPAAEQAAMVVYRAFELGAVLYYVGMKSNVLELTPPLTLTSEEARTGAAILSQAIADVAEGRFSKEKLAGFEGW